MFKEGDIMNEPMIEQANHDAREGDREDEVSLRDIKDPICLNCEEPLQRIKQFRATSTFPTAPPFYRTICLECGWVSPYFLTLISSDEEKCPENGNSCCVDEENPCIGMADCPQVVAVRVDNGLLEDLIDYLEYQIDDTGIELSRRIQREVNGG